MSLPVRGQYIRNEYRWITGCQITAISFKGKIVTTKKNLLNLARNCRRAWIYFWVRHVHFGIRRSSNMSIHTSWHRCAIPHDCHPVVLTASSSDTSCGHKKNTFVSKKHKIKLNWMCENKEVLISIELAPLPTIQFSPSSSEKGQLFNFFKVFGVYCL